jgi:putative ABC transport system permease protein
VVLKVLGATRLAIAGAFLVENGLLGLCCAIVAGGFGTLAAYLLVTRSMRLDWTFLPGPLLGTAAAAVLVALVFGFAGAWRALGAKPAAYLRRE